MNAQEFLWHLGRVSLQAGVLAVLVLLVQWLARDRLSARWRCGLWGLVLVRLLMPALPEARWSVFNWMPVPARSPQSILSAASVSVPEGNSQVQTPSDHIEVPGFTAPRAIQKEAVEATQPSSFASARNPEASRAAGSTVSGVSDPVQKLTQGL